MKYLLQIYGTPETWGHPMFLRAAEARTLTPGQREAMVAQFEALLAEITESGELVAGEALADPATTRTVRVRDGVTAATDGPYGEAKEQLAGFFVIDCDTPERATEIAARFPDARFAAVEVRPITGSADLRG